MPKFASFRVNLALEEYHDAGESEQILFIKVPLILTTDRILSAPDGNVVALFAQRIHSSARIRRVRFAAHVDVRSVEVRDPKFSSLRRGSGCPGSPRAESLRAPRSRCVLIDLQT